MPHGYRRKGQHQRLVCDALPVFTRVILTACCSLIAIGVPSPHFAGTNEQKQYSAHRNDTNALRYFSSPTYV
jgi:hypothetical protein